MAQLVLWHSSPACPACSSGRFGTQREFARWICIVLGWQGTRWICECRGYGNAAIANVRIPREASKRLGRIEWTRRSGVERGVGNPSERVRHRLLGGGSGVHLLGHHRSCRSSRNNRRSIEPRECCGDYGERLRHILRQLVTLRA